MLRFIADYGTDAQCARVREETLPALWQCFGVIEETGRMRIQCKVCRDRLKRSRMQSEHSGTVHRYAHPEMIGPAAYLLLFWTSRVRVTARPLLTPIVWCNTSICSSPSTEAGGSCVASVGVLSGDL